MRILHYSLGMPPYRTGGMTKYCMDLMKIQSIHNEVFLLWPGKYKFFKKESYIKIRKELYFTSLEIVNPKPIPLCNGIKKAQLYFSRYNSSLFSKLFEDIKVDVVHIHTLMGLDETFFEECRKRKIKIVYTTHDYFGICPKTNLFYNGEKCDEIDFSKCKICNQSAFSTNQIRLMQSSIYRKIKNTKFVKKIRRLIKEKFSLYSNENIEDYREIQKYYLELYGFIDIVHCNSSVSYKIFKKYLPNSKIICKNISHNDIKDCRNQKNKNLDFKNVKLLFLGPLVETKGFNLLIDVLDEIRMKHKNFSLRIYSRDSYRDTRDYIFKYSEYQISDLPKILSDTDILIVPSIWYETFGFVILEAISHGVPVLFSEYCGAKDLFSEKYELIFDGTKKDLYNKINIILSNPSIIWELQNKIRKMNFNFEMDDMLSVYKWGDNI